MDLPSDLAVHLRDLAESLDAGDSLSASLVALVADLRTAVSSYQGLRLTLIREGWPIALTAFDYIDGHRPATSLGLALSELGPGFDPESRIVLYAATPGAFVDLAADFGYFQRVHGQKDAGNPAYGDGHQPTLALDADIPPVSVVSGFSGLSEYATINRAVGVLIYRGHHPDHAGAELRRAADVHGLDLPDYAARLLEE